MKGAVQLWARRQKERQVKSPANTAQAVTLTAPLALVIVPTRELALQVSCELDSPYSEAGARVVIYVVDTKPSLERRALAHGAQIVVGTPGRLRDHLPRFESYHSDQHGLGSKPSN